MQVINLLRELRCKIFNIKHFSNGTLITQLKRGSTLMPMSEPIMDKLFKKENKKAGVRKRTPAVRIWSHLLYSVLKFFTGFAIAAFIA